MSEYNLTEQILLIKPIFKGREDVFAVRWEKGNKSGYMPAYDYDPYMYRLHKNSGGSFSDYKDKTYKPLTDGALAKHLNGEQFIGIYPLLKDNTTWFLAADFDKSGWEEECRTFLKACSERDVPAYLERSRSGTGGHVWIFFESPLKASSTRKLFIHILQECDVFSVFDKSSSFDRLFPNQDYLSGKGLGNLIALPFNKHTMGQGNNCFVDPDTLKPFKNQWEFLKSIKRLPTQKFNELFGEIEGNTDTIQQKTTLSDSSGKLCICLKNNISINRSGLNIALINFLKEELNFYNTEFFVKKKLSKNVHGTERYFNFIEEAENEISIPRGMAGQLLNYCRKNNMAFDFQDERKKLKPVTYHSDIQLRKHQNLALQSTDKKDFGVIVAPPGTGKTILGLKIIAEKKQPALIVVHRKQIADQWIERIQTFLGIPKNEVGKIGQGKSNIGKQITVAMIQSLPKELDKIEVQNLVNAFGTIIVDECHHIPAKTYRDTIAKLHTYYLYGLTATPFRKYNDGKLIFIHLGNIISEIKSQQIENFRQACIIIRNTELDVPFNSRTDRFETLSQILIHDSTRNKFILKDITKELDARNKVVVITERKEHIDTLNQFLKQRYETVTLSGDDSKSIREQKWKVLTEGNYQALITTGQFFGEGTDLQNVSRLFLAYPFSFKGKLIQYIGRVQRSEIAPTIYDYRDYKIDYLNRLFLKRNAYYRKLEKQRTLFDEVEPEKVKSNNSYEIRERIKLGFNELEFRYGSVALNYTLKDTGEILEFEIENDTIRPEFDILKPYFAKQLDLKKVEVDVHAEFENDRLVSLLAESKDIDRINGEMIESVRFRFAQKEIFGKPDANSKNPMVDLDELQDGRKAFSSEEELIDELLKQENVKHYKQIRYLVKKHLSHILKIRFVLSPFSFVFLLEGTDQYHIVMETLDTEEATYIWHFYKKDLHTQLNAINKDLNIIRNQGRQFFLENPPENFSRIIHDYTDNKKGFIIWKGNLEERLV
jgi:superfamily II DNA or RNA helicase